MNQVIQQLLQKALELGTSDLFVSGGKLPYFRTGGEIQTFSDYGIIESEVIDEFRNSILDKFLCQIYDRTGSCDSSYNFADSRFRLNFYKSLAGASLAARPVHSGNNLFIEKLNLPEILKKICESPRGLILVSGSTGCGKSTTLGAMVHYINQHFRKHILTIEDPIEYVHHDEMSLISQREINNSTISFAEALRSALRENPDVIVIGEMRDMATVQTAINAALTGHLVIGTVHTSNAVQTMERILEFFPAQQRGQAAIDLGMSLVAVISQRLIPSIDKKSMLPAVEILSGTPSVRKKISCQDFFGLEDLLLRNPGPSIKPFIRAVFELYQNKKISLDDALNSVDNRDEFLLLTKGMENGINTFRCFYGDPEDAGDASCDFIDMHRLLRSAVRNGASDLILSAGATPALRLFGSLRPLDLPVLRGSDVQQLLFSIITNHQRIELEEKRELDFALSVRLKTKNDTEKITRFRINGFYQRGTLGVVARVVNTVIPSPEELTLPPQIVDLAKKQQGLILITGPTGSGKSTTQASLINMINHNRCAHIITIEDPIEYVHQNVNSIIEQRELHSDTISFASALKYALRENPDVIMVGEMRDTDTIAAALTAAETGHLVFGTIHTNSAPQTIDRIVDSFPSDHQNQIRLQLAGVLLGVVSQRLLPKLDGSGRAAAFEIMIGTPAIHAIIREGRTHQLQSIIETCGKDGMITLEKSMELLYTKGIVSLKEINRYRVIDAHVEDF